MPPSSGCRRRKTKSRPSFAAASRASQIGDVSTSGGRLSFVVRDPTQLDAAFERMRTLTQPQALTGNRDWEVSTVDGNRIVLTPTEAGAKHALKD